MRLGQDQTNSTMPADYQKAMSQLSEGQHRLAYLENQMKKYKLFMGILTGLSLIVVFLNKGCRNDGKTK